MKLKATQKINVNVKPLLCEANCKFVDLYGPNKGAKCTNTYTKAPKYDPKYCIEHRNFFKELQNNKNRREPAPLNDYLFVDDPTFTEKYYNEFDDDELKI